jgi:NADH-quinone oxidoreductase subunit L
MLNLLPLIPAFPLLGFAILFVTAGLLPKRWITAIGVGSVGISALLALIVMFAFLGAPQPYTKVVWTWIAVSGFTAHIGFYLDALSGLMMLVVAFVSFLIHLYSAEFMSTDEGYPSYSRVIAGVCSHASSNTQRDAGRRRAAPPPPRRTPRPPSR